MHKLIEIRDIENRTMRYSAAGNQAQQRDQDGKQDGIFISEDVP